MTSRSWLTTMSIFLYPWLCNPCNAAEIAPGNGDALLAKTGDVRVHAGTYQLNHTAILRSQTHITCDEGAELVDNPGEKLGAMIKLEGRDISIDGCELVSTASPIIVAPTSHSSSLSLSNNFFHSTVYAHAIWIDALGVHGVKITGNRFERVGYGVGQNIHASDLTDMQIEDNTFTTLLGDAIELNNPVTNECCGTKLTTTTASMVVINHNVFRLNRLPNSGRNSGFCVGIAGAHDILIKSNDCTAWNEGIHIEDRAYKILINANTIATDDHAGHPYQSGIQVLDGHDIEITDNRISGMGDGIHIDYDPSHQVTSIKIIGNTIDRCKGIGLSIAAGSLGPINAEVAHNRIVGCELPILLIGFLSNIIIEKNVLGDYVVCPFNYTSGTTTHLVNIRENTEARSLNAISLCMTETKPTKHAISWER